MPEAHRSASLSDDYFDGVYAHADDPWSFETSRYEHAKYTDTLRSLPRETYANALEVGCSIGVLTERLAERCERLLSVDVAEAALAKARERCAHLPHVRFERRRLPETFPSGSGAGALAEPFDLILLSEVGYYWSEEDLREVLRLCAERLVEGGHLLLVHWTPYVEDYPLRGARVHEIAAEVSERSGLAHQHGHEAPTYLLDLYQRSTASPNVTTDHAGRMNG
jgi:SAM-dependent methyltransferase